MNSLSAFANTQNPMVSYIEYMGSKSCTGLAVTKSNGFSFELPSGKCEILVVNGSIIIDRFEICRSTYFLNDLEEAKEMFSILVGVCFEHGYSLDHANDVVAEIYMLLAKM